MNALFPLLAAAAALAGAADDPPTRLTLHEAVDRALAASAVVQQAQALQRAADADVRVARAGRLPQVDLQAGYSRQSNVPELFLPLPGGGLRSIFPNIPDNYRARAAVAMPLYTGGRLEALTQAAEAERAGAGHDVRTMTADVVVETEAAYWSLVTARQSERVLSEALQAYDAHLADAQNRERLGLSARNEVLAVQVERDRAELAALRARNGAQVAQANLARLLGLTDGAPLEPAESLDRAAAPEAVDLDALVESALGARSERTATMARIGAAEARVRAERAARLPQLTASAGYDYANPNRRILPPEARFQGSWDLSLSASWTVFDGGRTSAAVARARARLEAARSQLVEVDRRVRLQVTQRALDLQAARAAVTVAERGLEAAHENQRVASERYRAGVLSSAELLDAEVGLLRASLDRTDAHAQARLAEAALERALGR